MHPFLTRLGIRAEVQEFFQPFYQSDTEGNLRFDYGNDSEVFGMAFHRVPETGMLWIAGSQNFSQIRRAFICASAMEAIAYLSVKFAAYSRLDQILFISAGVRPDREQLDWICRNFSRKPFTLVFGKDILGRVSDLKIAMGLCKIPVAVFISTDGVLTHFRSQILSFTEEEFSLNAFEKKSRLRLRIATEKPKAFDSYFDQLKANHFNI